MRKLLIAANWKMNPPPKGSLQSRSPYFSDGDPEIVVFPTFIDLQNCLRSGQLIVGAQCGRAEPSGAFTGDVSMQLLKECGCSYVLCGHSERRKHHGETDAHIAAQVHAALAVNLIPILCIGETAQERDEGNATAIVERQVSTAFSQLKAAAGRQSSELIIAYEPIWAIGTGKTATSEEAQVIHAFIRSMLPEDRRDTTRILYGGSVKGENAAELFGKPDIDGALVGGASLNPDEFAAIVAAAEKWSSSKAPKTPPHRPSQAAARLNGPRY